MNEHKYVDHLEITLDQFGMKEVICSVIYIYMWDE